MKLLQILTSLAIALSLGACASTNSFPGYGEKDAKAGYTQAPFDAACASQDVCY